MAQVGQYYRFDYPKQFILKPDYTRHAGQIVQVVRPLIEGKEYDNEGETMYYVKTPDGWTGDVWESELLPLDWVRT